MYIQMSYEFVDIALNTFFQIHSVRTRNNPLTLYKEKFNCSLELYIFRNRCTNVWNLLPQNIACSNDLSSFNQNPNSIDLASIVLKASVNAWIDWLRSYSHSYRDTIKLQILNMGSSTNVMLAMLKYTVCTCVYTEDLSGAESDMFIFRYRYRLDIPVGIELVW